ncbi:MAG: MarR family transcriptional regulator [Burkholderiaceae bacterium]|nr:MAG: MarR family transcriptional regulator [Burkholderiaceae bacterium]
MTSDASRMHAPAVVVGARAEAVPAVDDGAPVESAAPGPARRPTRRERVTAVRAVVALFREFDQVARTTDVSMAQYRILLFLRNGPARAGSIAAMTFVKKPTTSLQLAALRERGWIDEQEDPDDGRARRLVLTTAGRVAMDRFEDTLAAALHGLLGDAGLATVPSLSAVYRVLGETRERRFVDLERRAQY